MNGVTIIVSNVQSILMLPMNHSPFFMHNNLEANESKCFVNQHIRIQVGRILLLDTKFSGKLYDRQNFLLNSNKLCGCFSLKPRRSNIISMHSICFSTDTGETKMMSKFISLKVLDIFTKGNLSVDIHASRLQSGNDSYDDIVDYFDKVFNLLNSKGGWNVYGWEKLCLINDVSLLGHDIKDPGDKRVLSQEISTNVVHIHQLKKDYCKFPCSHNCETQIFFSQNVHKIPVTYQTSVLRPLQKLLT